MNRSAVTCVILMLAIAAAYGFGVYLFPSLLPTVITAVHINYGQVALFYTLRQVGFILSSLLCGYVAVYVGYITLIKTSLALVVVGLFGLGLSDEPTTIGVALILLNCVAATIWIPMVPLVATLLPEQRRAQALGFIGSGTNYGVLANGLLVGWVTPVFGWRAAVLASACVSVIVLLALVLGTRSASGSRSGQDERLAGTRNGERDKNTWGEVLQKRYLILLAIAFLGGFGGIPCINYWSAWGRLGLGLSPHLVGIAWSAVGLLGILGGGLFGWSADRFGVRVTLVITTTLLAVSIGAVLLLANGVGFLLASTLFGLTFFPIYGLIPAYIAKSAAPHLVSLVCGFVEGGLGLGSVLGNLGAGWIRAVSHGFGGIYIMVFFVFLVMLASACLLAPLEQHQIETA